MTRQLGPFQSSSDEAAQSWTSASGTVNELRFFLEHLALGVCHINRKQMNSLPLDSLQEPVEVTQATPEALVLGFPLLPYSREDSNSCLLTSPGKAVLCLMPCEGLVQQGRDGENEILNMK